MNPWANFIRRKRPQERERKGKKGQGPKVQSRQSKTAQQRQAKMLLLRPPRTHTHTRTHTHIHTNIENTEIMISDTSETCRWDHNNNNHCLKSILHFVSLFELQTKIGSDFWVVWCSNVQLLGSPEGRFCNPVLSVYKQEFYIYIYTLTYYLMFYLYWLASLLLLFESLSWIFDVGVLHLEEWIRI
jgi:hypothetical protein